MLRQNFSGNLQKNADCRCCSSESGRSQNNPVVCKTDFAGTGKNHEAEEAKTIILQDREADIPVRCMTHCIKV